MLKDVFVGAVVLVLLALVGSFFWGVIISLIAIAKYAPVLFIYFGIFILASLAVGFAYRVYFDP